MSIVDLYESSKHRNNVAHFSAIVCLATIDGQINEEEQKVIDKFVKKLDITPTEYDEIIKNPKKYPVIPQNTSDNRLERLLDLFKTVYSDHTMDDTELKLIQKYAIQLGYPEERANELIQKSVKLFSGKIDFEEYKAILKII
ncbi:TerB family tellurite resistance protein [Tenacibaculum sp. IB213877]|uniref:tellurite resistance TerB family protein n=1 Tax=Tenacibaculum sp. IB213877 TaxID=3097351 RepID=UPI002A59EEBD|nr:TerB family tellurite resistance protein [Tenacibaculum sp. IB213877]MDY0779574.1 TerB family tellurite resistance protein [Tenacibaculum sp. IB213877]